MSEQNREIINAAANHISGCEGEAEPSDAFEIWEKNDLPKVEGATSDEIRQRLADEIELQTSTDLYDSNTADKLTPAALKINRTEYARLIHESLDCRQVEGHVETESGRRVYAQ